MTRQFNTAGLIVGLLVAVNFSGCGDLNESTDPVSAAPAIKEAPAELNAPMTVSELRSALNANENARFQKVGGEIVEAHLLDSGVKDISALKGLSLRVLDLGRCDIEDISVLKGMPLKNLILEDTRVKDISAIEGMQLEILHLQNTQVADISVLKGMPLSQLNLLGTKVTDLDAIQGMPLEILWVPETPLSDLSGIADSPMISLDIRATKVTDLTPLSSMKGLQRLNIVDCEIKDLTPLADIQLQRLLFTPSKIEKGIDELRKIPTLRQIGIDGLNVQSALGAEQFWSVFDEGGFREKVEEAAAADKEPANDQTPGGPSIDGARPAADNKTSDDQENKSSKSETTGQEEPQEK